MSSVKIISGTYRNEPVKNTVFTLVKGLASGKKGLYVTVKNDGQFSVDIPVVKIKVSSASMVANVGDAAVDAPMSVTEVKETDKEAMDRIASRFEILDGMSKACIDGGIRAMIVTGPPGVGKSHGVTKQMEKASLFDTLKEEKSRFQIVKGAISGIGLFCLLFKYSDRKNVLVFDDCDVFDDPDVLNVLKGALDSGKTRRISWNKDSTMLRAEGIPNSFNFHGAVIFITNLKMQGGNRARKIQAHVDALKSRCHFLDLTIHTERDAMLRVRQVHRDDVANGGGGLFDSYGFGEAKSNEILDFMWDNHTKLSEVSMRMALKVADLMKVAPSGEWKTWAAATCFGSKSEG